MIDIKQWMRNYTEKLQAEFGARIIFIGLQGSYGRGEATEKSDIDVVAILDELAATDIKRYEAVLAELPNRDLICGFLSGKDELKNWEPSDLFQFYYDTVPVLGDLDDIRPLLDDAAVRRAIRIGACNIYHACVHNMLHEKDTEILKDLYKSAVFVIQAVCYARTGNYIRQREQLLENALEPERKILEIAAKLKTGVPCGEESFLELSEELFLWVKSLLSGFEE